MATLGELFVKLGIDTSEFQRGLGEVEKSVGGLGGLITQAAGTALGFVGAQAALSAIGGAFDLVRNSIVGMNASLETSTLQFTTLMGDADAARKHVEGLFRFAAETPFETGPIINASRLLQTFGGNALNSEQNLRLVGDAAAAAGRDIGEVAFWVGRAYSAIQAGKPFGEAAMNLQEMGVMSATARARLEELQASGASADEVWAAFTQELHRFDGAMKLQAGTWQGLTSTISDNIAMLSATAFKPLFDVLKQGATAFAEFLQRPEVQQFAEALATRIASGMQQLATWITGTAIPALQQFASWAGENLLPRLQQLADWFTTTALPAIQGFVSGAWQQLKTGLTEAWTTIDTQVLPALQRFGDWFTTTALPAIQGFASQVQPLLEPVLNFFQSQFSTILLVVLGAIAVAFAAWAASAAAAAVATIAALLPVIAPIAAIGVAVALLKAAWENNWGGIQDKLRAVWAFIQPTIQAIFDHLARFWQEIQPKLQAAWDAIKQNIQTTVETIKTVVTTVFDAVKGFIERHGDEIKGILEGAWNVIEGIVKTVTAVIEGIIKVALDLISGNWSGAWESIAETANRVWEGIKQIVQGAVDIVKNVIQIGIEEAQRIWNSIWDGIQRKVDEIKSSVTATVQNLVSEVKGAFSGAIDWLWQAGRDIVQGLISGLSSLLGEVRRKAQEIADAVKGAVSDALKIFSPSRVMMELGELTGQGFLLGLDAVLSEPFPVPVPGQIGEAAGAAAPALAVTVHIGTVYANDPRSAEQAAQDVAYAIAEALRRRGML